MSGNDSIRDTDLLGESRTDDSATSGSTVSEITLRRLTDSINQFAASAITSVTVPEFRGLPGEDVEDFIRRFKSATITLNNELRCLALYKGLFGAARAWAKANIKQYTDTGDWKSAKKAMVIRFGSPNAEIRYHERLSKMKFDPAVWSLTSYVEEYSGYYKKINKSAKDSDVITALKLNLPGHILRNLNLLSADWMNFTDMKDLYTLIRRLEDNILPFEKADSSSEEKLNIASLTKTLNELKESIASVKTTPVETSKGDEVVAVAAVQHNQNYSKTGTSQNDQCTRNHYPTGPYKKQYKQNRDNRQQGTEPYQRQDGDLATRKAKLLENYYAKHGKPPGPCRLCDGDHWNRDCPIRDLK